MLTMLLKSKKLIFTIGYTVVFVALSLMLFNLWWESADAPAPIPLVDYLAEMNTLRGEGQFGDALALGMAVERYPDMPHHAEIVRIKNEIEAEQASYFFKAKSFLKGFTMGGFSTGTLEETTGTLISDFLVIGDVRDLGKQSYNYYAGEEVDEVIVALASMGFAAELLMITPEPLSKPVTVSANFSLGLLKGLRKVGAMSRKFADEVLVLAKKAANTKSLAPMKELMTSLYRVSVKAPMGTMPTLMRQVDNADELAVVARCVESAPTETVALLGRYKRTAMNMLKQKTALGFDDIRRLFRQGLATTTQVERVSKFIYRGRMNDIFESAKSWLMRNAGYQKYALGAAVMLMLVGLFNGYRVVRMVTGKKVKIIPQD